MIKVRFNLARGENYQKWQIRQGKSVLYLEPDSVNLWMMNCRLRNHRGTANKIFAGADKTVCAWVECEALAIADTIRAGRQLQYNPRKCPHWTFSGEARPCSKGKIDGSTQDPQQPLVQAPDRRWLEVPGLWTM